MTMEAGNRDAKSRGERCKRERSGGRKEGTNEEDRGKAERSRAQSSQKTDVGLARWAGKTERVTEGDCEMGLGQEETQKMWVSRGTSNGW